ncbi:Vi polysaccharide biosynthesis UDP-N-acetylglucosamine C-6 dehydrogenase TviB [uncultured Pseudoteredinibacter sp.]|uniref:Vi polysaccharide biosynthesis UDP-N-acetylglucosamine C-6 dehydrogenase TviB n=1 Tax=uncultured Pseudoteredinibacter sp. TaxID=1641701 RepID=UPI002622D03E|nr:Vi polysaccharide biosynthesis UDP-N-acetylglucosamine C-6 dehydrogenase TviB [uncultured Pseudoteredinibacter sp.]
MVQLEQLKIAVIGLGYVGLPLAVELSKHFKTIGFDINAQRVGQLSNGHDSTLEVSDEEMAAAGDISFSTDINAMAECNVYIVTVPTPIDDHKNPDLNPLRRASETVAKVLSKGDVVVYESTVYPGATEEVCVPVLERDSGLVFNKDFFAAYSPERINPGDKVNRLPNIRKITSGSTAEVADLIDAMYGKIIIAGTYKASSIKVAEAAKVIENTQRDVNIALINELALIFNALDIDTEEVLLAAGSKWNFLPFRPGLVGGHCIGIDPYYLSHKAQAAGYIPDIIIASRRINDGMGGYVADTLVKEMLRKGVPVAKGNVLVMGFTFKENCPDVRNSRVYDVVKGLEDFHLNVDVYDPWVDHDEVDAEYGLRPIDQLKEGHYNAVILAVAHEQFIEMGGDKIRDLCTKDGLVYDLKYVLPQEKSDLRL